MNATKMINLSNCYKLVIRQSDEFIILHICDFTIYNL